MRTLPRVFCDLALSIWLLLLISHSSSGEMVILSPTELAGTKYTAPEAICFSGTYSLQGPLVAFDSADSALARNGSLRTDGEIVLLPSSAVAPGYDSRGDWELFKWKRLGALAVVVYVVGVESPGSLNLYFPSSNACDSMLPMVMFEIGFSNGAKLAETLKNGTKIVAKIQSGDFNEWRYVFQVSVIPFRVIFSIASGITSAIALAKWARYIRLVGLHLTVPQLCLATTFIVALFRAIYHALDPVSLGRVFGGGASAALATVTFPFNLLQSLLLALYWQELLQTNHVHVRSFVARWRLPLAIIGFILLVLEVVADTLRGVGNTTPAVVAVVGALYAIGLIAVTCLFVYYGSKVMSYIRKMDKTLNTREEDRQVSKQLLQRTALLVILTVTFNLIWLVGLIMAALPLFFSMAGYLAAMSVMWVGVTGASLVQVLALKTPTEYK